MRRAWLWFGATVMVAFSVAPMATLVLASFRPGGAPTGALSDLTVENYVRVFETRPFGSVLLRSFVVSSLTTIVAISIAASAAFALAKLPVRGARALLAFSLGISMFPPIATVSPLFLVIRALGWRDTVQGLVVPYTTFALPLAIWILATFFRDLPDDLYRAARVDGCTPWEAFVRVILPVAGPGVSTTAILVFIFAWNELLFALTFTSAPEARTVPAAIALFAAEHRDPWGEIAAASTLSTMPLLLAALVFQRRIVSGLTAGAVKG